MAHNQGWEQELGLYNQYEEERTSNLDNLLMQFKEVIESTQQAFKSLEIQVDKLAEEVTKFLAKREENFVEVEAQEKSPVKEHESREKDEEKNEEQTQQQWEKYSIVENQQGNILQSNNLPHQLIDKKGRQGEHEETLSATLSLITKQKE